MTDVEIVGAGTVGKALGDAAICWGHDVVFKDASRERRHELSELGYQVSPTDRRVDADVSMICTPTPFSENLSHKHVKSAISDLNDTECLGDRVISIHSTVAPGTCAKLKRQFDIKHITRVPEFMRSRAAYEDLMQRDYFVVGADSKHSYEVITSVFPQDKQIVEASLGEASIVKYMSNLFAMTKISFANQMWRVLTHSDNVNPESTESMFIEASPWVCNTEIGERGLAGGKPFGGDCFPKDIKTFIKWSESKNISIPQCKATLRENQLTRTMCQTEAANSQKQ